MGGRGGEFIACSFRETRRTERERAQTRRDSRHTHRLFYGVEDVGISARLMPTLNICDRGALCGEVHRSAPVRSEQKLRAPGAASAFSGGLDPSG